MGSRSGYEYVYDIWMEDELLSLYKEELLDYCFRGFFIVDVRTNFKLKERGGADSIIATEKFTSVLPVSCGEDVFLLKTRYRLLDYWISEDEIRTLVHAAFDFAHRLAAEPQNAARRFIPIVVGVDVCTVQFEGELLAATVDRSIKPDCLIPMHVWPMSSFLPKETRSMDQELQVFLLELPRIRVEDVDKGLALMDSCPLCLRGPTIGAQISFLPCNHAFHNHCVIQWLLKTKSCPVCGVEVDTKRKKKGQIKKNLFHRFGRLTISLSLAGRSSKMTSFH